MLLIKNIIVIKIVSNKRKNQLKQNIEKEKNLLKKRYLVENCFATIKNSYKRICHIYDCKIKYFENFIKWHLHVKL